MDKNILNFLVNPMLVFGLATCLCMYIGKTSFSVFMYLKLDNESFLIKRVYHL